MNMPEATSSAEQGTEVVDALYDAKLRTSLTINKARDAVSFITTTFGSDGVMGERATELSDCFEEATEGRHGNVTLSDTLGNQNVIGMHHFASGEAEVRSDQFSAAQITENARRTLSVVLEEDSLHRVQDPTSRATVIYNNKFMTTTAAFEGEVGVNLQGLGLAREDIPNQDYGEGERMVADLGLENVSAYVRKDGENAGEHMQTLVWQQTMPNITVADMYLQGREVGMSDDEIFNAAIDAGKIPEVSVQLGTSVS